MNKRKKKKRNPDALIESEIKQASNENCLNRESKIDVDLNDFEQWKLCLSEFNVPMEQYIRDFFAKKGVFDKSSLDRLVFVYLHYDYLRMNVEQLIDIRRGNCTSQSDFVLKSYIKYLVDRSKVVSYTRSEDGHEYWHPDFGDLDLWYELIDSLVDLYSGYTEKYFIVYNALLDLKRTVLDEIEKENELFRQFMPKYQEIMESHKEDFSKEVYYRLIHPMYASMVVSTLFKSVKDGTMNDDVVFAAAKRFEARYNEK